jgi:hypothetical protein
MGKHKRVVAHEFKPPPGFEEFETPQPCPSCDYPNRFILSKPIAKYLGLDQICFVCYLRQPRRLPEEEMKEDGVCHGTKKVTEAEVEEAKAEVYSQWSLDECNRRFQYHPPQVSILFVPGSVNSPGENTGEYKATKHGMRRRMQAARPYDGELERSHD